MCKKTALIPLFNIETQYRINKLIQKILAISDDIAKISDCYRKSVFLKDSKVLFTFLMLFVSFAVDLVIRIGRR